MRTSPACLFAKPGLAGDAADVLRVPRVFKNAGVAGHEARSAGYSRGYEDAVGSGLRKETLW